MAQLSNITTILESGIRFGAVGRFHPKQLRAVASRLAHDGTVTWQDLEQIGLDLAGDHMFFCEVNIRQLNDALHPPELAGASHRTGRVR